MAPKKAASAASKKRARSKSRSRKQPPAAAAAEDFSQDVPPRDLKRIKKAIACINLEEEDDDTSVVASIQKVLRRKLDLNYVSETEILRCIYNEEDNDDDIKDDAEQRQNVEVLVVGVWVQKQKADKVFDMLDSAGKGVVVVEDLQLVAPEFLSDDIKDDSDLYEMIQEVDQSGDGILTKDDFYRIASQIQL